MVTAAIIVALLIFILFGADKLGLSKTQIAGWSGLISSIIAPFAVTAGVDLPQAEIVNFVDQLYASGQVISAEIEKLGTMAVSIGTGLSSIVMILFRRISTTASGLLTKTE